jgi:hypothetical protein
MNLKILLPIFWMSLVAAALPAAPPRKLPPSKPAPAAVAASGLSPDKGKFRILQQGQEVGTEQFEISPSNGGWMFRGDAVIHASGAGDTRATGQLRLAADGTPIRYDWTVQAPKKASGSVDFAAGTAKTSLTIEGKDAYHQDFTFASPKVVVLDDNLFDQYALVAQFYDWNAKGTQTFPVLIPQSVTPGSIMVSSLGPETGSGAPLEGLRVSTADLEVDIYFDARHRLIRLEVPAAKVEVTRQ